MFYLTLKVFLCNVLGVSKKTHHQKEKNMYTELDNKIFTDAMRSYLDNAFDEERIELRGTNNPGFIDNKYDLPDVVAKITVTTGLSDDNDNVEVSFSDGKSYVVLYLRYDTVGMSFADFLNYVNKNA